MMESDPQQEFHSKYAVFWNLVFNTKEFHMHVSVRAIKRALSQGYVLVMNTLLFF